MSPNPLFLQYARESTSWQYLVRQGWSDKSVKTALSPSINSGPIQSLFVGGAGAAPYHNNFHISHTIFASFSIFSNQTFQSGHNILKSVVFPNYCQGEVLAQEEEAEGANVFQCPPICCLFRATALPLTPGYAGSLTKLMFLSKSSSWKVRGQNWSQFVKNILLVPIIFLLFHTL